MISKKKKKEIKQADLSEDNFYINKDYESGESGNFFEYFFGIYNGELVLDLIYNIPDIGYLMDNVKYFVSETLDILKKYIICKYVLSEKKIKYEEEDKSTLEKCITEMEKLIKEYKIDLSTVKMPNNEKENMIHEIKKDEERTVMFIEKEEGEGKNFTYYMKKMVESEDNDESREAAWQLIFNHLKKE